jgi:glycosyltransferase involved in cell wall biosynthesis
MGYVFTSESIKAKIIRLIISILFKYLFNSNFVKAVFENKDDLDDFVSKNYVDKSNAILIRGAGVDVDKFYPVENNNTNNSMPSVSLVARMLVDKGVNEFISASKIVNANGVKVKFNLVGDPDPSNPSSIDGSYLESISGHNGLYWYGYTENIFEIYSETDIACLPSYREGLPKSLLEAAACGLPIITTDTIGCREVVIDGCNGLLIPVKSAESIATSITYLLNEPELRLRMGLMSREIAVKHFSNHIVIRDTLNLYDELMNNNK